MNIWLRMVTIAFVLFAGSIAAAHAGEESASPDGDSQRSMARFLQWIPGEYDNHEQVWQQDLDKVAKPLRHDHVIVVDAQASAIGTHTLFMQQDEVGKPDQAPGLQLMAISMDATTHAIRLDVYAFADEAKYRGAYARPAQLAALSSADVIRMEGCSIHLTDRADRFEVGIQVDRCHPGSAKGGRGIRIIRILRLSAGDLSLQDEGGVHGKHVAGAPDAVPSRNRRVRYFSGWTIVKKAGSTAGLEDQSMWSMVHFVIHNEGQIVPIRDDKTGEETDYSLQLAQLTYQNTRDPVLKLGLIENKSGHTVAYNWASTDAKQLGMNMRWFQAGVTQRSGDAAKFGFLATK